MLLCVCVCVCVCVRVCVQQSQKNEVLKVKCEGAARIQFCLQHKGARFWIRAHAAQSRELVSSESWEFVLRLNNAEGAFSKRGWLFFLDRMCFFGHRKPFHTCENTDSAKHPPVCLRSRSDFTPRSPPVEVREEERKKEELWERGRLWLSLWHAAEILMKLQSGVSLIATL